ncbi:MAG: VIT domain-containing protein [Acidobacteriota bacterium]
MLDQSLVNGCTGVNRKAKRFRIHLAMLPLAICAAAVAAFADAGVLIPSSDSSQPDPQVLSLADMRVSVLVDNQTARVSVRQIFESHVGRILEGQYLFAIHPGALISDFAVWDGPVRIPGVILERKRAESIYNALRQQTIDPGLLQQAEQGEEGGSRASFFSARVTPIPAYGTKRLELEYSELLPVEQAQSYFYFPFRPREFQNQSAGHVRIDLTIKSQLPFSKFRQATSAFPLVVDEQTDHLLRAHFEGTSVSFSDDFAFSYELSSPSDLSLLFYRSPQGVLRPPNVPLTAFDLPPNSTEAHAPGYFQATAFFNESTTAISRQPSVFVILFDTSLSVRWDRLTRQFEALEKVLEHLLPQDRFQLLLFNSRTTAFRPAPVQATPENIQAAREFVMANGLLGGTDLKQALSAALQVQPLAGAVSRLVLLSDGNATLGTLATRKIADWFKAANVRTDGRPLLKTYTYGIGNDCNKILLRDLAQYGRGLFEFVGETEATDFKLNNFIARLTQEPFADPRLSLSPQELFEKVYPVQEQPVFNRAATHWVGQYREPSRNVSISASAVSGSREVLLSKTVELPAESLEHVSIPRTWAKARVDFLLRKIELDGEDSQSIDEIIQLSRKYKFVTPYTSFLAAPRSLLRPRLIKPGDPVLRVRTDPDIVKITAIFPFGVTKPLRYLSREQVWQTRFLAPKEMSDGTYYCRLILRDKSGRLYEERKSFVIDSRAPRLSASTERTLYHPGETVRVRVSSDSDTRRIRARLSNLTPIDVIWSPELGTNVGDLLLPASIATGNHLIEIFAEDFAHNSSTAQIQFSVIR